MRRDSTPTPVEVEGTADPGTTSVPVTVYDSRETLVLGEPKPRAAGTVARLFDSEAPVAYDGTDVYLAIRLADGPSRSQTCYAVVPADRLERAADLISIIAEAVEPTAARFEQATPTQLAYVCESVRSYDPAELPWVVPQLLKEQSPLRCGVPQYSDALVVLDAALDTGESLAVSRREIYLDDESREEIAIADNIVVVDNKFDGVQYSNETQIAADRLKRERHNRRVDEAVESVRQSIGELRELGLSDTEIREKVETELPSEHNRSPYTHSRMLERLNPGASAEAGTTDDEESSRSHRPTDNQWMVIMSIGILILVAVSGVALWQFGNLPTTPTLPSPETIPFDASALLLVGAAVTLSGVAVSVLGR